MTTLYAIKPRFQALLRPCCRWLARNGVRPNQVTWAAILLSLGVGFLIAGWPTRSVALLTLPPALLLRMALNAIDGMLAREHGMQSASGAVLNEAGDVVSDALLYLPLALIPGVPATLMVLAVVAGVVTEVAGLVGPQCGAARNYAGPCGKSDRAFVFGSLALVLGCGVAPGRWVELLLVAMIALCALTTLRRARQISAEAVAAA